MGVHRNCNHDNASDLSNLIHRKAKLLGLHQREGFEGWDAEDVAQEILLEIVPRLRKFDPHESSYETFLHLLADRAIKSILRKQRAQKRFPKRPAHPPQAPVGERRKTFIELDDAVTGDAGAQVERQELLMDLERLLQTRSPEDQLLVDWLRVANPTEIARDTGIPRTTVCDRIRRLRRPLNELRNHLK